MRQRDHKNIYNIYYGKDLIFDALTDHKEFNNMNRFPLAFHEFAGVATVRNKYAMWVEYMIINSLNASLYEDMIYKYHLAMRKAAESNSLSPISQGREKVSQENR